MRQIQLELNRIGTNYPAIPKIVPANGLYGESTVEAVRVFQGIFSLPQTGIVNKATWYQIKYIFTAVKELSELSSEGLSIEEVTNVLGEPLRLGDYGLGVRNVQYFLNVIAYFNPEIPMVQASGVFNQALENQVKAFERFYGLNPDGVVDFRTFQTIRNVYNDIRENLPEGYAGSTAKLFPGYVLTPGLQNDDVREFQTYLNVVGQNIQAIPVVPVTGYFGPETENAVRIFQESYGLPVTGTVGAPTWDAVAKEYNYIRFGTERTG